jgi:hypothetical protein
MYALPQDHVRHVLGNARFMFASLRDAKMLADATATASPEANHAMAIWDPQGKGFCPETVSYDLANLATYAIHKIRVNSTRNDPVSFTFRIVVGDYDFKIRGTQAHRGGDILARVVDRVRSESLEMSGLDETVINVLRRGGTVFTWSPDGGFVSTSMVPFDKRSW